MKSMLTMLLSGFLLMAALWLLLFVPAGTLNYWQAWLFFAVVLISSWVASLYLLRKAPDVVERRKFASEPRRVQQALAGTAYFFWCALVFISALDHRFDWSVVPKPISVAGFIMVAIGIGGITLVFAQNSHAATTIRVEEGQPLISTGIYGVVRHPMYLFNSFLYTGTAIALGSYWGLVFAFPTLLVFALRIRDEEKLLQEQLDGYDNYMRKVPHRMLPGVW